MTSTPGPDNKERRPSDPLPPLSRRHFLGTVLGGLTGLVLQACGRAPQNPTGPTPTTTASASGATATIPSASATGQATAATGATAATALPSVTGTTGETLNLPMVSAGQETRTPTATASATPQPTLTPAPTESPTITPSPGPSQTPVPTRTPRPQPTPFPPGPPSKLGLHVGFHHPMLETLLRTGNVPLVKTLEFDPTLMEFIKQISPSTIVVARYTPLGQINLAHDNPREQARRFVDTLLPVATDPKRLANIDAWEAYNEPVVNTPEEMRNLGIFEAERTRLLAAAGVRSVVGNFATGTPPLELWPEFFPALQAVKEHNGFLGLHEYSAPYMWFGTGTHQLEAGQDQGDEGWLTLRYRKVYRRFLQPNGLDVPLVITETGIDGGIVERPGPPGLGWQDFGDFWDAEGQIRTSISGFYMEQLAWYDSEMQKDEYVRGSAIYILGGPTGWGSFEILNGVDRLLEQYLRVHPAG